MAARSFLLAIACCLLTQVINAAESDIKVKTTTFDYPPSKYFTFRESTVRVVITNMSHSHTHTLYTHTHSHTFTHTFIHTHIHTHSYTHT
jgi:hypothetical protein